jgi:hypothetical protein
MLLQGGGCQAAERIGVALIGVLACTITGCRTGREDAGDRSVKGATIAATPRDSARPPVGRLAEPANGALQIGLSSDAGALGEFVATLLLTDPHGRRAGIDPATGDTVEQIPGASYADEVIEDPGQEGAGMASLQLEVMAPDSGSYLLAVQGIATGRYAITIRGYNTALEASGREYEGISISPGEVHRYIVEFDPARGAEVSGPDPVGPIGVAVPLPRGRLCVAVPSATLSTGATVTLVEPDPPQRTLTATIEARRSCPGLERATVAGPYYSARPETSLTPDGSLWLVFPGRVPTQREPSGAVTIALGRAHHAVRLRSCSSSEGVHLTVWSSTPLTSRRLWHQYYYLGYDVEPTCTDQEVSPRP